MCIFSFDLKLSNNGLREWIFTRGVDMASRAELEEFQRWWDTEGDWVEEPNERRKGMSGVQRIECLPEVKMSP